MKNLHNRVSRDLLLERLAGDDTPRFTFSFYKYAHILNPHFFRDHLYTVLDQHNVLGRIYISKEGINGQASVTVEQLNDCTKALYDITFLEGCRLNMAIEDNGKSFFKLTIKVREKIVADGLEDETFDTTDRGKHIGAEEFNAMADDDDTIIIDMRNHYESEVGHFEGAICPDVETFKESLPIVENILSSHKEKNILLYCTGGIRCEKASAYFKHRGFEKMHQLNGGIIEYARQCKNNGLDNKFKGKNFVFDERLGEIISDDVISKCHQCGKPSNHHKNCKNDHCHILFIQCEECATTYNACCSAKCQTFYTLPDEEREKYKSKITFNGTSSGKGRYNGLNKDEKLLLP
ncbi:MAG: rhodanese-related sulfurtransferase [Saprospiraceae bacterium]